MQSKILRILTPLVGVEAGRGGLTAVKRMFLWQCLMRPGRVVVVAVIVVRVMVVMRWTSTVGLLAVRDGLGGRLGLERLVWWCLALVDGVRCRFVPGVA